MFIRTVDAVIDTWCVINDGSVSANQILCLLFLCNVQMSGTLTMSIVGQHCFNEIIIFFL